MNTLRICERCRAPLAPDSPQGVCPACLLTLGLGDPSDAPTQATGGLTPVAAKTPRAGEEFGPYKIIRVLGRGGMGEVFEAEHAASGRRVALKVMNHTLGSESDRKRFLREGRLAASVSHPNAVYIYGSEEIHGTPVIAMELVAGGTLKDKLKRGGPLPVTEAVEAVLHVIDGLEAAHAAGVLHRDIKPANCFVTGDGAVKVGDFGLSISTLARGESLLTASGSVLGTPAYASPEQLRGEDLDVASDIYSVGATLYHLLTGRPPHETTDFVKLITEVLDKTPPAPDKLRPEVPAGLAKVILRCLAKDRAARFPTYAALKDALMPFSRATPAPAPVGLRFVAGIVDEFFSWLPAITLLVLSSLEPVDMFLSDRTGTTFLLALAAFAWQILYYAVAEGRWGAGLGKALCGLRVTGARRDAPGVGRAAARAAVFSAPWTLGAVAAWFVHSGAEYAVRVADNWTVKEPVAFVLFAALWVSMRRRNGFAALHDLLTATRVITRAVAQERPKLAGAGTRSTVPAAGAAVPCGPYEVVRPLGGAAGAEILLARDPVLRRAVWIHRLAPGADPVPARRRDLSRAARLRWLNGHRDATSAWDAYEAPDGSALMDLIHRPQPWAAVRFWLHDLAQEIAAEQKRESGGAPLALERVWITGAGRALLLDFPCPAPSASDAKAPPPLVAAASMADFPGAQKFLHALADVALRGPGRDVPPGALPLHAGQFLQSLAEGRFENAEFLLGNIQSLLDKPASVGRQRRAAALALAPVLALTAAVIFGGLLHFTHRRSAQEWPEKKFPGSTELRRALTFLQWTDPDETLRRPIRIHIAARHRGLVLDTNFWAHPAVAGTLDAEARALAEEAVRDYADASPGVQAAAGRTVAVTRLTMNRGEDFLFFYVAAAMFWMLFTLAVLVDLFCVVAFRRDFFLHLFGIAIVNRRGQPAGRWRLLFRVGPPWAVCYLLAPGTFLGWVLLLGIGPATTGSVIMAVVLPAVVVALAAVAVWKPGRGLQDRLTGTFLVVR